MLQAPRLLLITDRQVSPDLEAGISSALQGGSCDVLLRDKTLPPGPLTALARRLLVKLVSTGGRLIIHDRADIALAVEAHGVHLTEAGMETADVRRIIGPHRLLGRSCHDAEKARKHLLQGGDYVTLSPVYATASHPDATPLGLEAFARMRAAIPGPVLALGGIHAGNVAITMQKGAFGVALIRGVLDQPDPGLALQNVLMHTNAT